MPRLLVCIIALVTLVWSTHAYAQSEGSPTGDYARGKAQLEAGQTVEALSTFKAALQKADVSQPEAWQLLLAVAVAYKDLERAVESVEYFRRFLAITDPFRDSMDEKWRTRRERVGQELRLYERALARTHAFLRVESTPPGVELTVDGTRAGADRNAVTPFTVIVPAGTHVITGELAGLPPITKKVTVLAGQYDALRFEFDLSTAIQPPPTPQPVGDIAASVSALRPSSEAGLSAQSEVAEPPVGAIALIAVGIATAAGGGVMTYLTADAHNELSSLSGSEDPGSAEGQAAGQRWLDAKDQVALFEPLSYALYGAGAAAILGGIIWLATDGEPSSAKDTPSVGLVPTTHGLVGHATWRFE